MSDPARGGNASPPPTLPRTSQAVRRRPPPHPRCRGRRPTSSPL